MVVPVVTVTTPTVTPAGAWTLPFTAPMGCKLVVLHYGKNNRFTDLSNVSIDGTLPLSLVQAIDHTGGGDSRIEQFVRAGIVTPGAHTLHATEPGGIGGGAMAVIYAVSSGVVPSGTAQSLSQASAAGGIPSTVGLDTTVLSISFINHYNVTTTPPSVPFDAFSTCDGSTIMAGDAYAQAHENTARIGLRTVGCTGAGSTNAATQGAAFGPISAFIASGGTTTSCRRGRVRRVQR